MTYPAVVTPDVEAMLTTWLRDQLGVTTGTDLPEDLEQVLPVIQVTRLGGPRVQQILSQPRIDVDCFAPWREQARDLAADVEARLLSMRGATVASGTVGLVEIEVGASWRPDYNPRVRRHGVTAVLTIRPA
jgi:hypothetical protein